ncbi:hypothetical protein HYH03_015192 [Edaphochlamys debaryana]|uniref:Cyclin N-terminal domain-containing protein n=1 Tax=Edaphochlamys debaryana TaxID=47281 RepID=A0A835XMK8_9CHLO|nr:hypothetical protein HYH03_015192 [Edaphochlamys debaryana]|eukprot:KAG2486097.1 hypothetical protein HYH03_015192 [Edaphochlamys debaryana]
MMNAECFCPVETPERSLLASEIDDLAPATGASGDSCEPVQPSSSADSELCSLLACDEDGLETPLEGQTPVQPAASGGGASLLSRSGEQHSHQFFACEAREAIRNELYRQEGLCFVPCRPETWDFARKDRPRIVSWLVEVVTTLRLSDETLHAAVSLLDRFAAGTGTLPPENVLQLLALACISLAAKHEEVAQYRADDWVGLAVDPSGNPLYQRADLQRMEWLLLETVDWRIRVPSALTFLRHFHHAVSHDPACAGLVPCDPAAAASFKSCACFLAELSLLHDSLLPYGYSTIATACLVLAEWTVHGAAAPTASSPACDASASASAAAPIPTLRTVSALTGLTGVDATVLAPQLGSCVNDLHKLYAEATTGGPNGGLPSPEQLGLVAPVVLRYTQPRP